MQTPSKTRLTHRPEGLWLIYCSLQQTFRVHKHKHKHKHHTHKYGYVSSRLFKHEASTHRKAIPQERNSGVVAMCNALDYSGEVLRKDVLPALGITQTEFANRLGVSRLTVSELLHEKRALSRIWRYAWASC